MPPPPNSPVRFQPLILIRSLLSIALGYGVFWITSLGAIMLAWSGRVALPSAVTVPLAVVLLLGGLVAGGAVAGRLAGRGPGGHGMLLGVVVLVVMIVGLFTIESIEPWWFRVVGAVVAMPMAYLGAEVAGYKAPPMPPAPPPIPE